MKKFVSRMEKYLIRLVVLSLVVMVVVQAMMTQDQYRLFLSWGEKMEGESINYPVSAAQGTIPEPSANINSPHADMTIAIDEFSSLPRATVLVNGNKSTTFVNQEVHLQVMAGDTVEIDSRYYNFPVNYKIINTSPNLAFPDKGSVYTGNQGIVMIGKIIVK